MLRNRIEPPVPSPDFRRTLRFPWRLGFTLEIPFVVLPFLPFLVTAEEEEEGAPTVPRSRPREMVCLEARGCALA